MWYSVLIFYCNFKTGKFFFKISNNFLYHTCKIEKSNYTCKIETEHNIIQHCLNNFNFCLAWLCLPLVCSLKLTSFSSSCSSSVWYWSSLWRRSATDTSWRSWRTRSLFFIRLLCNRFSSLFFSPSNYKAHHIFSSKTRICTKWKQITVDVKNFIIDVVETNLNED